MNKTAIIIGATGLVGAHLLRLLIQTPHIGKVVVITRRPLGYESEKIENHVVDFDSLENHENLFAGDIFFSCLGTTLKQAGSIEAQRVVDLDYQIIAAELAQKQGVKHYLLVSSSGANHTSSNAYLKMKGELEVKIEALQFDHISVLQPSLLLGERDQSRLGESIGSMVLPIICKLPGLGKYRPIHGKQVAQKMLDLSVDPKEKFERIRLDKVFPS